MQKDNGTKAIINFLKLHPAISVNALEIACYLPKTTIAQAMLGNRLIPAKHMNKLILVLIEYGFKV